MTNVQFSSTCETTLFTGLVKWTTASKQGENIRLCPPCLFIYRTTGSKLISRGAFGSLTSY